MLGNKRFLRVSLRISSVFTGRGPSGREAGFGAQGGDGGVVSFGTGAGAAGGVVDDAGGIFPVYGVNVVGVFFLLVCQGEGAVQGQFGAGHFCFSCLLQPPGSTKGQEVSEHFLPFAFIYYNFIL